MNKLDLIPNAAVLIRNDVIESVGPAPRIENLAAAKNATEINATGKIILPAFVESDGAILHGSSDLPADLPQIVRISSRRKLTWTGIANSAEYARYGTLSAGITALFGDDLRTSLKLLQTLQSLQGKPLRIRPVFSARAVGAEESGCDRDALQEFLEKWLPAIKQRKLSSMVEIAVPSRSCPQSGAMAQSLALAAANLSFSIRIRAHGEISPDTLALAASAGATTLLANAGPRLLEAHSLLRSNTVIALPARPEQTCSGFTQSQTYVRRLIDAGAPVALCMGTPTENDSTRNMQHSLFVACNYLGMTPEEAITAATFNAAYSLRTSHRTGSLEPGKCADLLVMDVPDYRELVKRPGMSNVELAMRAGQVVYKRQPLILD